MRLARTSAQCVTLTFHAHHFCVPHTRRNHCVRTTREFSMFPLPLSLSFTLPCINSTIMVISVLISPINLSFKYSKTVVLRRNASLMDVSYIFLRNFEIVVRRNNNDIFAERKDIYRLNFKRNEIDFGRNRNEIRKGNWRFWNFVERARWTRRGRQGGSISPKSAT